MSTLSAKAMKEIREAIKSTQFDFFMDDGKYNREEPNNCYLRWTIESGLYKGQTHILQIRWNYGSNEPKQYPRNPPNVKFITPMWHTNVNCGGGSICVDILREDPTSPQAWSPIYGLTLSSTVLYCCWRNIILQVPIMVRLLMIIRKQRVIKICLHSLLRQTITTICSSEILLPTIT